MKVYESSRRQDMLAGSLVPTLIVCLVVWLDRGHMFQALSALRPIPVPPNKPFVIPPDPVEIVDAGDTVKTQPVVAPIPQIPDIPQPIKADSITQPIEPPAPDLKIADTTTIPGNWSPNIQTAVIFNPSALDQQPSPTHQARPVYPGTMRLQGAEGTVVVDFIVDSDGFVRNATAIRSTNAEFAASAVAAVSRWRFTPGRKANHAVFTHMQVPVEFKLDSANP